MAAVFGYTLNLQDTDGARNVIGQSDPKDGVISMLVRANAPGIFMGGTNVANSLPGSGFEMTEGKEYEITSLLTQLSVATLSTTPVTISVFATPKI